MFFNTLINDEEVSKQFANWFWEGENGNVLIEKLNSMKKDEIISRGKDEFYPHIYGIILNEKICKEEGLTLFSMGYFKNTTVWGGHYAPPL